MCHVPDFEAVFGARVRYPFLGCGTCNEKRTDSDGFSQVIDLEGVLIQWYTRWFQTMFFMFIPGK